MYQSYKINERIISMMEYRALCSAVGWGDVINFKQAEKSLPASIYSVVVEYEEEVVGMGRLVGDGHLYFYIQDVAVHPDHQGKGIGKEIVSALLKYIKHNTEGDVFVGLFSTPNAKPLYESFGFSDQRDLSGMFSVYQGDG